MIGLYVQQDTLRAVDITKKSRNYVLKSVSEHPVHLPMPDRLRALDSEDEYEYFLQNLSTSLSALFSGRGFASKDLAVAVDIRNVFIHTVPFDGDFTPDNVRHLIEWELNHFFPDIPNNAFLFDTYNPGYNPAKDISPKFIYTAVLRSYIRLLQHGINKTGKKLLSINVDQFTLEPLLKLSVSEKKRERLNAVFYRYNEILFCSLLWNHRLVRYREYMIDEINTPEKQIVMFLSSLTGARKNIDQYIYYYPFDESIIEETEKNTGWKFDRFKSFDKLKITRRAKRNFPESMEVQEGFAPAVSVALKN